VQPVPIITSTVVCLVFGYLLYSARRGVPTVNPATGNVQFRYSAAVQWIAIIAAFGSPILITVIVIARPSATEADHGAILMLYALFAALSFPLLWETARMRVTATSDGLENVSAWLGKKSMRWSDIQEVSFSAIMYWFVVRATDGRNFRVPFWISGVQQFLALCEQNLPPDALRKARAAYGIAGRKVPEDNGRGNR
jgi:hypothetical protein